jgi:single-stranded DNA-specific DHH superfamily exonuclease
MEFLIGGKQEFFDFLDSIKPEDKLGILTHTDLDGIASGIFMQLILEAKGHKVEFVDFMSYGVGTFNEALKKLKDHNISKVFITDVGADIGDPEGFRELKKNIDCFLIDHHPINEEFREEKNIMKTETADCSSLVIYDLGENIIDQKKWKWLVCASMIADYSFKKKENLEFIQKIYPDVAEQNIFDTNIGKKSNEIVYALIYYGDDKKKVYNLLLEENLNELKEISDILNEEIKKQIEKFRQKAEYYPERNLYYFYTNPKFNITSIISTILSSEKPNKSFVIVSDKDGVYYKVSARNQGRTEDMNILMKKCINGLKNATGGGHIPAAAAQFLKKDLDKFKENLLS